MNLYSLGRGGFSLPATDEPSCKSARFHESVRKHCVDALAIECARLGDAQPKESLYDFHCVLATALTVALRARPAAIAATTCTLGV